METSRPGLQRFRKVDEDRAVVALVFEFGFAEENLVDGQRGMQVELDAVVVLEHLETNGVLAADRFLFRIDAHVEMVVKQIVVGAIPAIFAAQNVGLRRRYDHRRP